LAGGERRGIRFRSYPHRRQAPCDRQCLGEPGHYSTRDFTAERLRVALELFILHFPIYRTYVTPSGLSREEDAQATAFVERLCLRGGADQAVIEIPSRAFELSIRWDPFKSPAPFAPVPAGRMQCAWEEQYRAIAVEHHRLAGM
jgi:hypothetical protein